MLRNRLYYGIKPFLPRSARLRVRSWFALRRREHVSGTWPILPGSERPPEGWSGWPDGKQFAFVITHDVDSQGGVDKCRRLMELEMKLGFRSSFNFIPEGEYRVPKELREELVRNGFEVGVHDLHHDGKLYSTREGFTKRAARINHYLKEWNAVGFRSGFMLHKLEWLHGLDALYDSSTFDTDPFEPQPDGVETIFPFWVPRPINGSISRDTGIPESKVSESQGYIELPYTLPQDSTLFLLLYERHPDIWFQKLDWIARHGGMALINIHPDYIKFLHEPESGLTFPVDCYSRLLEFVRTRYGEMQWHTIPSHLAAYVRSFRPRIRRKPRRVCMVTYSAYESDARVTRYAEALAETGDQVDVLALRQRPEIPKHETMAGVNVVRLQGRFGKNEKSRLSFILPVARFLATTSLWIARRHARKPYDILHIHNVPDFLVFAGWYPKLRGAKIILDIHDILPEFYANKFGPGEGARTSALARWIERVSAGFADRVIVANDLWLYKYAQRTGANGKSCVFINNVDAQIFRRRPRTRVDDKFIVIFPGGLQWHQGLDIAIRAFPKVAEEIPRAELHIYGDGNMKEKLVALAAELGLSERIFFFKPLPVRQIADVMANADLGIVPKRADSFGNEAYSTKIMEFMSLGVPVVVSSTRIDRFYFNDSVVRFFESGNYASLAQAILQVFHDPNLRVRLATNAFAYADKNGWESRKGDYLRLVSSLVEGEYQSGQEATNGASSREIEVAHTVGFHRLPP